jgi:hypothetical protein
MRVTAMLLLGFTLAACGGPSVELPLWKGYVEPSMPTAVAAQAGIKLAATEEKITGPIEVSEMHHTDFGPGSFMVCMRGTESVHNQVGYYAVFFDNDVYKGSRVSAILEGCEQQNYRPFVPVEGPEKSVGPKPHS